MIVTVLSRPQPLGVLPLPAGWLVLPAEVVAAEPGAEARDRLLAGVLPERWPDGLRAVELAAAGDVDAAAAVVARARGRSTRTTTSSSRGTPPRWASPGPVPPVT